MNIYDKAIELLALQDEDAEIIEIFKTGSQLFRDNPRDIDYVIVCNNYEQRRRRILFEENNIKYDFLFLSPEAIQAQLDFNNLYYLSSNNKLFNYLFIIKETVYGNYNVNWNMLNYKNDYLSYAKEKYTETVGKAKIKKSFGKSFVHYYIILKMFENNSTEITNQMRDDIQKLYSGSDEATPIIDYVDDKIKQV